MDRRRFLSALAAGGMSVGLSAHALNEGRKTLPNIVLILVDDLGYEELGCQGNKDIPTPNIDALAKNGVRCTDGYVSAPVCCPSRAGMITGRYQTRFGHELNLIGLRNKEQGLGLPLDEKTIGDHMRSAGYATCMVGKWHLGGTAPYHPLRRGFDEFYGFLHEGHFFLPPPYSGSTLRLRVKEPLYDLENPMLRGEEPIVEDKYLTDALTREAVATIDRHRDKPFFLYLPFNAVHSPLQATLDDVDRFKHLPDSHRVIFAGMLASLDDAVGEVMAKLREHGLEENTLVFFLSDNGGPTAELTSSNLPLRGGKGNVYEGGVRVPFIVQWKDRLPAGKVYEQPVSALDILPTALAAAGAKAPDNLDGVDLVPYLTGKKRSAPHDTLFWRYNGQKAIRKGKWKLIRDLPPRLGKRVQLFDLENDIAEENDLSEKHPEVVAELTAAFEELNSQMVAPLWGGRKPKRK